jgi:hypothetical protein
LCHRGKITDLICDQELVLSGPPYNPVVNLDDLSHTEFVNRAKEVITPLNPEGHPPPGVYSPTMQNLIDRLEVSRMKDSQSYASVVKDGSPRSSSSSVQSYNGSVLSEDLSESLESANMEPDAKEVTAKVQSVKSVSSLKIRSSRKRKTPPKVVVEKANKKAVSFSTLDMEKKNSQYAISTVQEKSALPRRVGSREVKITDRLGDYYTGHKKITSSALSNSALLPSSTAAASSSSKDVIDLNASIEDNSSDERDAVQDYSQEQHDDVLFPKLKVNQEPSRRHSKVSSLQDKGHTALSSKTVDETDISDASSDESVIGYELPPTNTSSTPAHLRFTAQETTYLRNGFNGALFYAHVRSVDDLLGEVYVAPPLHAAPLQVLRCYNGLELFLQSTMDHISSPLQNSLSVGLSKHAGNLCI